jgi:hypothetical protein
MAALIVTWLDAGNKVAVVVGSGAPTNGWAYGAGSLYSDTSSGNLYRYDGATWTNAGTGLTGPQGIPGQGSQGVQGATGDAGQDGVSFAGVDSLVDEEALFGLPEEMIFQILLSQG